jgi:hypothetical protein
VTAVRGLWLVVAAPLVAFGCGGDGGGGSGGDAGNGGDGGVASEAGEVGPDAGDSAPATHNAVPLSVNQGPPGSYSDDVPFVSVTICVPGTTTCQTIEDVIVDTGSSGFRVFSSALSGALAALPQPTATGGSLVECGQFDSGYTWGPIKLADIKLAGETAANVPIQVIADPQFSSIPNSCSSSGTEVNSVADLGGNGLLGINQIVADCGDACTDPDPVPGAYYTCAGSTCTVVGVPLAQQVSNPIASFASDNNGSVLQFPTIPAAGAATLTGQLILGIGTAANNGLGSAKVLTLDDYGNFTTAFNGQNLPGSFIDSGSNSLAFNDGSIPDCSGELNFLFCPPATLNLTAQNTGLNGVTTTVSFSVANAETLFQNPTYTVFDDVAGPGENGSFDWGFPFFIGRSVYIGLAGAVTPGGKGPFVAY